VLAPTTVLAAQHHRTFVDRYAPFPVRVEMISRFRSPSEVKKVLNDVETGDVDVLIGTHRLLSKDVRFRRLVYFYGWWYFAASFGAPFFHPFMLKDLGMSLTAMQAYNSVFVIAMAATASLWGKIIDRFGNKPVLRALITLAAANAFVYVFMEPERYWWVWIEAVTSGAMWGGAIVATTNFIIRLSPEGTRDSYVALYAVVAGACGLVGTIGSGQLVAAEPFASTGRGGMAKEKPHTCTTHRGARARADRDTNRRAGS